MLRFSSKRILIKLPEKVPVEPYANKSVATVDSPQEAFVYVCRDFSLNCC